MSADGGTGSDRGKGSDGEALDIGKGLGGLPEERVVEIYPLAPPDELPPPTFRQALIGYGSIMLGLVLLGVLLGVLMRVLR